MQFGKGNNYCQEEYASAENVELLKKWINIQSQCEESFTALHFASFYGNIYMCKYLLSMGGDAFVTNQHYINMLHVAA